MRVMAAPVLTFMPETIVAGTTLKYLRTLSYFPANDGWTLKLSLAGLSLYSASASGADHQVTIAFGGDTGTGLWEPGTYDWSEIVEKAGEKYVVASGTLVVIAHPSSIPADQARPFWEQVKEKAEDLYLARLTQGSDVKEFEVAGRQFTLETLEDIERVIAIADRQISRLRSGQRFSTPVVIRPRYWPWQTS